MLPMKQLPQAKEAKSNMKKKYLKRKWIIVVITSLILLSIFYIWNTKRLHGEIVITSLSSDAHYAITTDSKNHAILWNLNDHKKDILSYRANMYSAYWIKRTPYYMWQDLKNKTIHIANVKTQKDVETLHPKFLVYGQVMSSDLKYHVVSDINWNIFVAKNRYLKLLIKHQNDVPGFEGANKLLNFNLINGDKLLSSGFSVTDPNSLSDSTGIYLYNLSTMKPVRQFYGNMVQTFATISPDGKYVVAGDGNGANLFVWNTKTGKRIYSGANLYSGITKTHGSKDYHKWTHDNSQLIKMPTDFSNANVGGTIQAIKFIDNEHYLVFHNGSHYAILYTVCSPWPIKYLNLGKHPMPALEHFERDQSMDTSPSTHTLVMAKEHRPGILVYKYNPTSQTLKKVWDAD